jgi:hypothetical protein
MPISPVTTALRRFQMRGLFVARGAPLGPGRRLVHHLPGLGSQNARNYKGE